MAIAMGNRSQPEIRSPVRGDIGPIAVARQGRTPPLSALPRMISFGPFPSHGFRRGLQDPATTRPRTGSTSWVNSRDAKLDMRFVNRGFDSSIAPTVGRSHTTQCLRRPGDNWTQRAVVSAGQAALYFTGVATMRAIELLGEIDDQHRLRAQVPEGFPVGSVRVIVLMPEEDEAGLAWAGGISAEWSAELGDPNQDIYTLDDGQPINAPR